MNEERQLTPKERFDAEMKGINNTISNKNANEKEAGYSDEEVQELDQQCEAVDEAIKNLPDEEEVEIDKNMGDTSISMTREQFGKQQLEEEKQKLLKQMTSVGGMVHDKLTAKQKELLHAVLEDTKNGVIKDPVLTHLINKKLEIAKRQIVLSTEIKETQETILKKLSELTREAASNRNAIDVFNEEILSILENSSES